MPVRLAPQRLLGVGGQRANMRAMLLNDAQRLVGVLFGNDGLVAGGLLGSHRGPVFGSNWDLARAP